MTKTRYMFAEEAGRTRLLPPLGLYAPIAGLSVAMGLMVAVRVTVSAGLR